MNNACSGSHVAVFGDVQEWLVVKMKRVNKKMALRAFCDSSVRTGQGGERESGDHLPF